MEKCTGWKKTIFNYSLKIREIIGVYTILPICILCYALNNLKLNIICVNDYHNS